MDSKPLWATARLRCTGPEPHSFDADSKTNTRCPECHNLLGVEFTWKPADAEFYKELFRRRRSSNAPEDVSKVSRFREFLPFSPDVYTNGTFVTLGEGNHPLIDAPQCAAYAGVQKLFIMHEGIGNPSGSFKDLGMCVAVTQAKMQGYKVVGCASTGNTSASAAAYARRAGMKCVVFVPAKKTAFGKLSQAMDYGAKTVLINGNFDEALELLEEIAEEFGIAIVNSLSAFRPEGQKTAVFDMYDQLDWQRVDRLVLPLGNGGNTRAFFKGLCELKELGFIDHMPRITAVQARFSNPVEYMYQHHLSELIPKKKPHTMATAINIGNPVNWKFVKEAIDRTDGWVTSVDETEIADAKAVLGLDGIGGEPASAVSLAGLRKLRKQSKSSEGPYIRPDETIVMVITGHQLKDPDYTTKYHLDTLQDDKGHKLSGTFSNKPFEAEADRGSLCKTLEKALSS